MRWVATAVGRSGTGRRWREREAGGGRGARGTRGGGEDDGEARLLRRGVQATGRIGGAPLYRL
eukprot:5120093-Prymnesium_polylepis.1